MEYNEKRGNLIMDPLNPVRTYVCVYLAAYACRFMHVSDKKRNYCD